MNRTYAQFIKSSFLAIVLAICFVAHAFDPVRIVPVRKADVAQGARLYSNGDGSRNLVACVTCHGPSGNSTIAQNPKLAGQHAAYIFKQLNDFKTEKRTSPIMGPIAKSLNENEMHDIAAYLDTQLWQPAGAINPKTLALGKNIYRAGISRVGVPACAGCHGPAGAGIPIQYPRLGGQHQDYTSTQLKAFRTDARENSLEMAAIAKRLTDEEIQAVADYIAGLATDAK